MGKTHLLRELAVMARRLSIRPGGGVADPGDTVVQMSVLMEALFEGLPQSLGARRWATRTLLPSRDIGFCRTSKRCWRAQRSKDHCWSSWMTFSGPTAGRRPRFGLCPLVWPRCRSDG